MQWTHFSFQFKCFGLYFLLLHVFEILLRIAYKNLERGWYKDRLYDLGGIVSCLWVCFLIFTCLRVVTVKWDEVLSAHEAARSDRERCVLSLWPPLWRDGADAASCSAYEVLRWCRGVTGDSAWKVHAVIHSWRIGILCSHRILSWEARVLCLVRCIPVYSIYKHKTNMEFLPCHPLWSWWGQNELFCRPSAYYGCLICPLKLFVDFFPLRSEAFKDCW